MAFKKLEYKKWHKFFHDLVFKNGANPYLIKNTFMADLINDDEDYEGARAALDVFNEWYERFKMSEKQTSEYISTYYKNHPIYGQQQKKLK